MTRHSSRYNLPCRSSVPPARCPAMLNVTQGNPPVTTSNDASPQSAGPTPRMSRWIGACPRFLANAATASGSMSLANTGSTPALLNPRSNPPAQQKKLASRQPTDKDAALGNSRERNSAYPATSGSARSRLAILLRSTLHVPLHTVKRLLSPLVEGQTRQPQHREPCVRNGEGVRDVVVLERRPRLREREFNRELPVRLRELPEELLARARLRHRL